MQNSIPKLRQRSIISMNPSFLSEKLKILTSSKYHRVKYFFAEISQRFLLNASRPKPRKLGNSKSNLYLHTSLWCLKTFYGGLKDLHKTFWGTTKECQNENLTEFLFQYNFQKCKGTGRVNNVYKRVFGLFFILFRSWVINENIKNEYVETRSF